MSAPDSRIYKVTTTALWARAKEDGVLPPSPVDEADGFMHFSTLSQLGDTLRLHFRGQSGLVILTIAVDRLSEPLKWEPSRGGDLFPHLYAPLPMAAIVADRPVTVDAAGASDLPADFE